MSVKTLTINGQMVTGVEGESIFDVAWNNNIRIPRICHLGGLSEIGACRMCLVEVEGQKKLSASCLTRVEEGMVIHTDTDRLRQHRKLIIELLLAERNHQCAVCVQNGNCELQDLAEYVGIDHVRLRYQFPKLGMDTSHDRFGVDHNRCVLCSRCVRVCDEVEGAHTWDIQGRGKNSLVITDLGEPWGTSDTCTSCGKCVQICPTGALFEKGMSVAESRKDRRFLKYIVTAREKKEWIR